jgi:hypothetical protein
VQVHCGLFVDSESSSDGLPFSNPMSPYRGLQSQAWLVSQIYKLDRFWSPIVRFLWPELCHRTACVPLLHFDDVYVGLDSRSPRGLTVFLLKSLESVSSWTHAPVLQPDCVLLAYFGKLQTRAEVWPNFYAAHAHGRNCRVLDSWYALNGRL